MGTIQIKKYERTVTIGKGNEKHRGAGTESVCR